MFLFTRGYANPGKNIFQNWTLVMLNLRHNYLFLAADLTFHPVFLDIEILDSTDQKNNKIQIPN